jgi:hypothetical protein
MKTVNSLSGGKTSSFIAVKYPADYNVFSLVRTHDKSCLFPDEKVRQMVSDRLGVEFIGTLEMDTIIYTMLDLEQMMGRQIDWITGPCFDDVVKRPGDKKYLPNKTQRFCTIKMKIEPIFYWWADKMNRETCEMRIGFRANETRRAKAMLERCDENGIQHMKGTFEKHPDGRNKWIDVPYRKPTFPLIDDGIFKDSIEIYWQDKSVRFAEMNNCVGCFHRSPILLKHMSNVQPDKFDWFVKQEQSGYESNQARWKTGMRYEDIKRHKTQLSLSFDDFNECDSGYCGL